MYFNTKPEVNFNELKKERGFLGAIKDYKKEREMWRAINDNYNLFFTNLGILSERSWVKYMGTTVKSVIDDTSLSPKGVYVLHRFKLSDDLSASKFEKQIKHIAEKMVLAVDAQIKLNQEAIYKMGVKQYAEKRKKNPDYMQSTKDIESEKDPLSRFHIYYKNGEMHFKILFEKMPIRRFKPIKPKENHILLGLDLDYKPLWWNWSSDINLYIAGTTGSGKTTVVHAFIINTLIYNTADLYLIDRKDSDFRPYRLKKGVVAFGASEEESSAVIEQFYEEFLRRRILLHDGDKDYLNVEEYNLDHPDAPLTPYVLVIDEFADIAYECMSGGKVEKDSPMYLILKEAAQIRNTGGHNLIATQRPDANVLPGLLKAQFSGQLGMRVINELNSKIVIDESGLENIDNHCFRVRLDGKLTDGISYYLDTPMIKQYIAALPNRKKSDNFHDVKQKARESLMAKIQEAQEALRVSEDYLKIAETKPLTTQKAIKGLETAKKKNAKAIEDLEKLEEELSKL